MAWIDDRIWCHPKWLATSPPAKVAYINSLAYSSGMATRGHLTREQQQLVGATTKVRAELVDRGWWDENGDGSSVTVHDWDEHNAASDDRRAKARERMRQHRRNRRT